MIVLAKLVAAFVACFVSVGLAYPDLQKKYDASLINVVPYNVFWHLILFGTSFTAVGHVPVSLFASTISFHFLQNSGYLQKNS